MFDAAYNTNENLLISAPTGAGKTNIAMLTILREIKQNIEAGVIQKDKFKVYCFPLIAKFLCVRLCGVNFNTNSFGDSSSGIYKRE